MDLIAVVAVASVSRVGPTAVGSVGPIAWDEGPMVVRGNILNSS